MPEGLSRHAVLFLSGWNVLSVGHFKSRNSHVWVKEAECLASSLAAPLKVYVFSYSAFQKSLLRPSLSCLSDTTDDTCQTMSTEVQTEQLLLSPQSRLHLNIPELQHCCFSFSAFDIWVEQRGLCGHPEVKLLKQRQIMIWLTTINSFCTDDIIFRACKWWRLHTFPALLTQNVSFWLLGIHFLFFLLFLYLPPITAHCSSL